MKLISYKQEIGAQKIFWAQEPHRVLCGFNIKSELYTIRFKDDKMILIPRDIDQELPRGITPKTKEKTLKN